MKVLVGISQIFVAILFLISGFIKLNDPVGFSFKLKDYFAADVLNLEFLVPYALLIAIFVVIFEVLLGIMLLIGYARKFTTWSLLLMILFFTFLTFYSAYFNKVTDCGCFGDALKLTPWQSFYKDLVLLVLIVILFFGRKHIASFFTSNLRSIVVFAGFVGCLGMTYFVLQHLPIIDFRPYKIGANITEGMAFPEDAPKPIFEYQWKFNIDGKEKIITTNGDYPKVEGEFIGVETEEVQAGYEPPIHDFSIERDDENFTEAFLTADNVIVIVAYTLNSAEKDGFIPVKKITDEALKNGYQVIGLSSSSTDTTEALAETYGLNFKFYFCDETALKTIVRSNPGILELQKGTVKQKLHWNDASDLKLRKLEKPAAQLNLNLKQRLDSIAVLDQRYRKLMTAETPEARKAMADEMGLKEEEYTGDLYAMQRVIDSANLLFVERILGQYGYPGSSMVGQPTNSVVWNVIQHNPESVPKYLDIIKKAGQEGELSMQYVAIMEDRYLMNEGKKQIYGTQGISEDGVDYIWPIENPETVNDRRAKAGFAETIEAYGKTLFGPDFEYKVHTLEAVNEE
ncbi:BT_3928 family protein [Cochleicola gelatinilyticus]|uniref:DoxX family protein n=1 Tax=Cochleicola gelatinilyticus TaxID=1763537 RepID=A0A167F577_9FLAO|nr:BT_3928 family protein [Cochleicola gelatinilyticus]OAB76208.1 DoxX family protein [Cochleicola gelatinilyticus]